VITATVVPRGRAVAVVALSDPQVSFVVPVLNEADNIAATLSLLNRDFPGCEVLVVDGGSVDDTVSLARPLCDRVIEAPRGRANQMNAGAASARGHYLLFLHADTRPLFAEAELLSVLADRPDWGYCQLQLSGEGRLLRAVERGINLRSRLSCIGSGDQLQFFRREVFEGIGGFPAIPLMEDIAICHTLQRSLAPKRLSLAVRTSSRRWEENGVLATVLLMWWLRLLYAMGVSPVRLWRWYYG